MPELLPAPRDGDRVNGLRFEVGCPDCGGDVAQVAAGVPEDWRTQCVIRCLRCGAEHLTTVTLSRSKRGKQVAAC